MGNNEYVSWIQTYEDILTNDGGKGSGWFKENGHIPHKTTGAISGALDMDSDEADNFAKQYYESIRKSKGGIQNIVNKTGLTAEEVIKAKEYLFIKKHKLSKGYMQFEPDPYIAQSWQRLTDPNMEALYHDIIMIKHELLESKYEEQGMSYQEAHKKANEKYNYEEALDEYKKHNKRG